MFSVDFVADGPHALVGGTTGAGKSELLRTLVASLAASVDPDHLTFVLVDFKGGSAFDECARLPHTVGMVTDLDEHLAERALALPRGRAQVPGADAARRGRGRPARLPAQGRCPSRCPGLLVIIDEFATLKAELPEFIDALVGVAQRGRSLGVHMLLATQRPQGAINENIKANTNMRIALRVQEDGDSATSSTSPTRPPSPARRPGGPTSGWGPTRSSPSSRPCPRDPGRGLAGARRRGPLRVRPGAPPGDPPPPVDPAAVAGRPDRRSRGRGPAPARPTWRCWCPPSATPSRPPGARRPGGPGPTRCRGGRPRRPGRRSRSAGAGPGRAGGRRLRPAGAGRRPRGPVAVPGGVVPPRGQPDRLRHRRQRHHHHADQPGPVAGPHPVARRRPHVRHGLRGGRAGGPRARCRTWGRSSWPPSGNGRRA